MRYTPAATVKKDRIKPGILLNRFPRIKALVEGQTVLDIGCVDHELKNRDRSHWLHDFLREHAASVTGIDLCEDAVKQLEQEGYDVVLADATNFDLEKRFDVVVAGEVIEHVVNPGRLLECAANHLSPGGIIVLTTPNADSMRRFFFASILGREHDNLEHACIFSPDTLARLAELSNLRVKEMNYVFEMEPQGHNSKILYGIAWVKNITKFLLYCIRPVFARTILCVLSAD